MDILNTKLYAFLQVVTNLFLLNLVWLVACVPVVTFFPATAALFGVVREWRRRDETATIRPFLRLFAASFRRSLAIALMWVPLGVLLLVDAQLIGRVPTGALRFPLYLAVYSAGLLYVLTSVYLFPVLVHYETSWRRVIRNAFILALTRLPTTALCVALLALIAFAVLSFPVLMVIAGSGSAYLTYGLCDRSFPTPQPEPGATAEPPGDTGG